MAIACLMSSIAGAYTAAWNSNSVGKADSGIRLIARNHQIPVRSDYYGDSLLDLIYRGQDVSVMLTSQEYSSGIAAGAWPWDSTFGMTGTHGTMACGSGKALPLVLTAVAGTTAASTPASLTGSRAILQEGHTLELLYANQLRQVPLAWNLLPYTDGGNPLWFSTT